MLSLNTASVSSCSTSNSVGIDDPWKDHTFLCTLPFWGDYSDCGVLSMMICMIKMMMMNMLAIMILLIRTIMTMMMMMMMMIWRWGVQVDILQLAADDVVTASSQKKILHYEKRDVLWLTLQILPNKRQNIFKNSLCLQLETDWFLLMLKFWLTFQCKEIVKMWFWWDNSCFGHWHCCGWTG